jgi:acetyltransferase-like isoleucine patch superfamily enzyme
MFCFAFSLRATDIGGTISANTTWNLAGSPYNLVGYTRVNYGVTLNIDPGVVVVGNGNRIEIFGILSANGNSSSMILFTNVLVTPGSNLVSQPYAIVIRNTHLVGGNTYSPTGNGIYGTLTLEDCQVENPTSLFYIWYPVGNCSIQRNIFIGGPSSVLIATVTSGTNQVLILNNVFYQTGVAVENNASYNPSMTFVSGNNFLRTNFPTLVLPSGYTSANMVATNNYWGTVDTNVINQMIYDKNDATDSANYISYVPFLTTPNPNAAQVPFPIIQAEPQDESVFIGDSVTLTVQASGLGNLSYQWHAGVTDLLGQTNSTLTLTNVQQGQAGSYSVTVCNFAGGGIDSQTANLSVQPRPPSLTVQPTNQLAEAGQSATFSPAVIGTPPLYFQWQMNSNNLGNATNLVLLVENLTTNDTGNYQLVITNVAGSATSSVAVLTVGFGPVITSQPTNQIVLPGQTASFTAAASSASQMRYQWLQNQSPIYGATNSTFNLYNSVVYDMAGYSVIVANMFGSVTSSVANLFVIHSAEGYSEVEFGFVVNAWISDAGYGYASPPIVRLVGGGGSGAMATATVSNGVITGITILNAGSGYTNTPNVAIAPPFPLLLGIAPAISLAFTNLMVGTNYQLQVAQSATWVNLGSSFAADAANYTQYIDGTIDGSIYRLMALPLPYGATATPVLAYGFVVAAMVNDGGYGYMSAPAVQIIGGGGSGANCTATVSNGVVTAINMSNAGFGYSSLPTIQIDPPPVPLLQPSATKAVRLDFSGLTPALAYQVQSTPDLMDWTNFGATFTATDYTNSQYLNVDSNSRFLRLWQP